MKNMSSLKSTKKNKKRAENFSNELKRKLAAAVKLHPRIWDVTDRLHCRKEPLEESWSEVSAIVGRPANECKSAWTSLKESRKYYANLSRREKSCDEDEMHNEPISDISLDWEFAEDLAFLPITTSQKRKSFQTSEDPLEYDSSCHTIEKDSVEMLEQVGTLIDTETKLCELRTQTEEQTSNFKEELNTFQWLLKKLPQHVADEACLEITQLLVEKAREQRNLNEERCSINNCRKRRK